MLFVCRKEVFKIALLNEHYIFVETEDFKRGVSVTEHPVESGLDITDNVKRNAMEISITGEIVGSNAAQVLAKITKLHQSGSYVKYIGRNILSKAIITEFDTSHPNTIHGGCAFTMSIKEVRIAKKPLVVKKTSVKKQITHGTGDVRKYVVKRGDTLWAIAKKYYGNGAKYTVIVDANKNIIKNPNLIYPNQTFVIP